MCTVSFVRMAKSRASLFPQSAPLEKCGSGCPPSARVDNARLTNLHKYHRRCPTNVSLAVHNSPMLHQQLHAVHGSTVICCAVQCSRTILGFGIHICVVINE
jgi:hypothetical protein